MSNTPDKFYVTTPIYYVNARPHIGHAYTTIVADVVARRHRLLGEETWFLTGTDEHGQKIERSANAAGVPPQQFADDVSAAFRDLWKRMGITNNDFIRTTDARHQRGVQKLFADLYNRGEIYLSSYTGQYSVGEEMFVEGPPGTIGPDGRPTETVTEENFFFRLSKYQLQLLELIESSTLTIQPDSRRNEVLSFLRGNVSEATTVRSEVVILSAAKDPCSPSNVAPSPSVTPETPTQREVLSQAQGFACTAAGTPYVPGALKDLSVSRSSFTWGIPVPEPAASVAKEPHVIYVWLDALANYMTALGYGSDNSAELAKFEKFWPADLHLVGKEIIRFHCVYWPAFLLAAGLPLPKSIVAHGWLLFEDSKMSKSRGNIVRTETILDGFGDHYRRELVRLGHPEASQADADLFASDVLRYFLLREIPFGQDGSFSFDAMITRYNADLANGYGNLVSRVLAMIAKYFAGELPHPYAPPSGGGPPFLPHNVMRISSNGLIRGNEWLLEKSKFNFYLELCSTFIKDVDESLSRSAPWKELEGEAETSSNRSLILNFAAESIRILTALLYPILPYTTAKVWTQLGLGSIEDAAARGDLRDLQWGGLKPGTKLGPLAPIFPRAPKELAQIMTDLEAANAAARPNAAPKDASTPSPAAPVSVDPTHPAAPPRTAGMQEPHPIAQVGGAAASHPELPRTPSHVDAEPSGVFAGSAAATSINATTASPVPQITIDDFAKVELRVARILVAERIPKADKLLRLEVDLGSGFNPPQRQILSGIAEWYTPEELVGRKIVVITNLAPRTMRGLESHGMLLAASDGEGGKPVLATFAEEIEVGTRLK